MEFRRSDVRKSVLLPRRSLAVMAHECRYAWCALQGCEVPSQHACPLPRCLALRGASICMLLTSFVVETCCPAVVAQLCESIAPHGADIACPRRPRPHRTHGWGAGKWVPCDVHHAGSTTYRTERQTTSMGTSSTESLSAYPSHSGGRAGSHARASTLTCATAKAARCHPHVFCSYSSSSNNSPASTQKHGDALTPALQAVQLCQHVHRVLAVSMAPAGGRPRGSMTGRTVPQHKQCVKASSVMTSWLVGRLPLHRNPQRQAAKLHRLLAGTRPTIFRMRLPHARAIVLRQVISPNRGGWPAMMVIRSVFGSWRWSTCTGCTRPSPLTSAPPGVLLGSAL